MMAFDDDAPAQLHRIRTNLDTCTQTTPDERGELSKRIDAVVDSVGAAAMTLGHIHEIGSAVRYMAAQEALYFRGTPHRVKAANEYFSTRAESRLVSSIARSLADDGLGLSVADQLERAKSLTLELSDPVTFAASRVDNANIPLHAHGTPMWLASAMKVDWVQRDWLDILPARLGLGPDSVLPTRYIAMRIRNPVGYVPRFVDSGGYPYWMPGGYSKPLQQCPHELSGFEEIVADQISIGSLRSQIFFYSRTI